MDIESSQPNESINNIITVTVTENLRRYDSTCVWWFQCRWLRRVLPRASHWAPARTGSRRRETRRRNCSPADRRITWPGTCCDVTLTVTTRSDETKQKLLAPAGCCCCDVCVCRVSVKNGEKFWSVTRALDQATYTAARMQAPAVLLRHNDLVSVLISPELLIYDNYII